jgi:transcriptional regulator with XRE-family HTH domain
VRQYSKTGLLGIDGYKLSRARIAANLSMREVSIKLQCNIGNISKWEQGRLVPPEYRILELVALYKTESFIVHQPMAVAKRLMALEKKIGGVKEDVASGD